MTSTKYSSPTEVKSRFEEVKSKMETAKKDYEIDLMVMFVGAYSAGKSTLINTICEKDHCEVGIKPTTQDLRFIPWNGVQLVDSPGLDAMDQEMHQKRSLEAAGRANVAVLVMHARQALRESERPLLKQMLESKSQVLVVLNFWNSMAEKEKEDCMVYIKSHLQKLLPNTSPLIIPTNANDANDEGVKMIRHLLSNKVQSTAEAQRQKVISAKAAVKQACENAGDTLKDYVQKLEVQHTQRCKEINDKLSALNSIFPEGPPGDLEVVGKTLGGTLGGLGQGVLAGAPFGLIGAMIGAMVGGLGGVIGGGGKVLIEEIEAERKAARLEREIRSLQMQLTKAIGDHDQKVVGIKGDLTELELISNLDSELGK